MAVCPECEGEIELDEYDVDSFLLSPGVNVDFRTTFHPRLVVAPAGGANPSFDVTVTPK